MEEVVQSFKELATKVDVFQEHLGLKDLHLTGDKTILGVLEEFRAEMRDLRQTVGNLVEGQERLNRRIDEHERNRADMDVDDGGRIQPDDIGRRPTKRLQIE